MRLDKYLLAAVIMQCLAPSAAFQSVVWYRGFACPRVGWLSLHTRALSRPKVCELRAVDEEGDRKAGTPTKRGLRQRWRDMWQSRADGTGEDQEGKTISDVGLQREALNAARMIESKELNEYDAMVDLADFMDVAQQFDYDKATTTQAQGMQSRSRLEGNPMNRDTQPAFLQSANSLTPVQRLNVGTALRVGLPSALAAIFAYFYFDNISLFLYKNFLSAGEIQFLSSDEVQFIPSFLQVLGLLSAIITGNAYQTLYQQQETIYLALFLEVSEAKSLLEQCALVCQGRPFYPAVLQQIKLYIRNDLRRLDLDPVDLIAQSPRNDPLEKIMFMTSVGVPSTIYETVKNLRQARGFRLGACQRKFPRLGIWLLYILASIELAAFPLLGAGSTRSVTAGLDPSPSFGLQSLLFAGLTGATVLVLRIIEELWQSSGGTFNVDITLDQMIMGLEAELDERAATEKLRGGGRGGMSGSTDVEGPSYPFNSAIDDTEK